MWLHMNLIFIKSCIILLGGIVVTYDRYPLWASEMNQ